MRKVTRGRSI